MRSVLDVNDVKRLDPLIGTRALAKPTASDVQRPRAGIDQVTQPAEACEAFLTRRGARAIYRPAFAVV